MNQNTGTDTMDASPSPKTSDKKPSGRVVVVRQPRREGTELWQSVHVVGPENGPGFAQMLARAKCRKSENGLQDADFVVFTGGSVDIHPELYGVDSNETHDSVWFENQNCIYTMMEYLDTWQECYYVGIPMVGVCLGAQFLHVMNGGKLYQDVDNHNSDHALYCARTGQTIMEASSVHHQMCIENPVMEVLGTTCETNERWRDRNTCDLVIDKPDAEDIEAFWYKDTASLGFQGHPEYQGYPQYTEWCLQQINHHLICNPDLHYVDNCLRMKDEVMQERQFTLPDSVHKFIKEYS